MNHKYIFIITIIVLLFGICIGCFEHKPVVDALKKDTKNEVKEGKLEPIISCNPEAGQDCCIKHEGTWDEEMNNCSDYIEPQD
jgi:hypothetical protein